jgi:general secretion pathway protein C
MDVVVCGVTVHDNRPMVSRFAAFVIWAAVAFSSVFWAMRLWAKPIAAPAHATVVSTASGFQGDLGRVLGTDAPPPVQAAAAAPQGQADARFRLIGVVAPRSAAAQAEGLALIATEGKPPKAYRVGTAVDGELVLLGVHSRGASLGPRGQPAQVALELPVLPPPSTGPAPGTAAAASPAPRAALPFRPTPQQPQAAPMVPVPVPPVPMPMPPAQPDADDADAPPPPAQAPYPVPPGTARPPTVDRRPPT